MGYASLTKCRNPDGWFQIGYADDLAPGQVKPLKYFNRDLVLWRGHSGAVFVQDAHCKHLGAHRGHVGHVKDTVKGDNLLCPWHMWEWDGEGKVVDIPYSPGECKPTVKIRAYETREWCGNIMMWHHHADEPPSWELPSVICYDNPEWYDFKPSRLLNRIKCHVQMPVENAVDFAHIYPIHKSSDYPVCKQINIDGTHFQSIVQVPYGGGKKYTDLTPNGPVMADIDMNEYGIGAALTWWGDDLWPTCQMTCFTPVDDDYIDYFFAQSSKRAPGETGFEPEGKAQVMLRIQHRVIPQDFFIWENMTYLENGAFSKAEAELYPRLRAWAQQFYPDTRPEWERRQTQEGSGKQQILMAAAE